MIAELGQFSLILAALLAMLQLALPWAGLRLRQPLLLRLSTPLPRLTLLFVALAFGLLVTLFLQDDFSVGYVTAHSNTRLPLFYKISAVWGGHEGSLLLWTLLLTLWSAVGLWLAQSALPVTIRLRMISVLGGVAAGFLLFMALTSSPFERLDTLPTEGRSLNPLLQDPALALHPPLLYAGYVGLALPYALAMAMLWAERFSLRWADWMRMTALAAWSFLTLGIALGSWWAYYELGWGGWWFWDPVENASLLPWLVSVALIHSLIITRQRGIFQSWALLLAIAAFGLSLLGTFLVRSGVLTSVHAFANDPGRGLFILMFMVLATGIGLWRYGLSGPRLSRTRPFALLSRETVFLLNNALLLTMMATILLGTLYPLLLDALGIAKISVGAPYFNTVMAPLTVVLALLMGLGMVIDWGQDRPAALLKRMRHALAATVGLSLPLIWWLPPDGLWRALAPLLPLWILFTTLLWAWQQRTTGWHRTLGVALAHGGMAVTLAGIILTAVYGVERDVRLAVGEQTTLAGVRFTFVDFRDVEGPNYVARQGRFIVEADGARRSLISEKRAYDNSAMPMTEAGIDLIRGWFVALGEPLPDGAWAVRLQVQPHLWWIWLGALLMALGGLLAMGHLLRGGRRA